MTNKKQICVTLLQCLQYGAPTSDDYDEMLMLKKYKFQNSSDDIRVRSSIDLVEDTEDAITNFCQYQLCSNRANPPLGERYLRLYGILNAVYLQVQSIIQLAEVLKYPNKRKLMTQLSGLKIIEIRNIAGAHTVNFKTDKTSSFKSTNNELNFFRLTQSDLKEDGRMTVIDMFHNYEKLNLLELVLEYNVVSETALANITAKYINTLCKNDLKTRKSLHETLQSVTAKLYDYSKLNKYKHYDKKILNRIIKNLKRN
jgi:hypothetical protein